MDDGKNMAARIGGIIKVPQKALVWQFLDGMMVLSSWTVNRPETQFLNCCSVVAGFPS